MINYSKALQLIATLGDTLKIKVVNIEDALGAISNETLKSPEALPAFNNSAMDGFALNAEATTSATIITPLSFSVDSVIAAGDDITSSNFNNCVEIMTGAVLPDCYNCVIPIEEVMLSKDENNRTSKIAITRPLKLKENVRFSGEDFQEGDIIINKNDVISPEHIMTFAALGIRQINVIQKPKVAVFCTGSELTDCNIQQDELKLGQIRNSNGPYLLAALFELGCDATFYGNVSDLPGAFIELLDSISSDKPDLIISTGAVSAGIWDFIPKTLKSLNATTIFHKVKIRPGKPILCATLANGTCYFGLSGNPIAAAVGLRFFVNPYLRLLQSQSAETPFSAVSLSNGSRKPGFGHFLKAHVAINAQGQAEVTILPGQESFKMKPMLSANCWVALDEHKTEYKQGDILKVYPLHGTLSSTEVF